MTGIWFALLTVPAAIFTPQLNGTNSSITRWLLYFVTLTLLTVGVIWTAARILDRRYFPEFGLHLNRDWWIDFAFGLVLGAVLVSSIFTLQVAAGYLTVVSTFQGTAGDTTSLSFAIAFLTVVALYTVVGIEEELAYRGYILTNAAEGLNDWRRLTPIGAIVLAAVFSLVTFGLSHLPNQNASAVGILGIVVGGLVIAAAYVLTGELAIPMGVHIAWNVFLWAVFGFPTSGLDYGIHILKLRITGPSFVTGGAFGPEAGVLLLGTCFVGLILLLGWLQVRYGSIRRQRTLATPTLRWR